MHQYVKLGAELVPGVREIVSSHTLVLLPPALKKQDCFVQVKGKYCGIRNVTADYCYTDSGEFTMRADVLKKIRADRRREVAPKGITWGTMSLGFGDSFSWFNYSTVKELIAQGAPVKVLMWGGGGHHEFPRASWEPDYKDTITILNVRRRSPTELFQKIEKNAHTTMGYFQCEGTKVHPRLIDYFKHFDVMLATSEATKEALVRSGITCPMHVFGHGIDALQFPKTPRPLDRKPYTFFHFADVQARKGTDILIKAFKALKSPDVRLYIKAQWENPESKEYRKETASDKRVTWDFKRYEPAALSALVEKMDCGVFPSRAEGFGLPKLECEATGLPVIATDAFGYKDTSIPDGTILLKVAKWIPTNIDAGDQAEPDLDHLISLMEKCSSDPAWAAGRGAKAGENAHANWKWSDKVRDLLAVLKGYGLQIGSR